MLSIFNYNFFGAVCAFVEIIYLYFFIFKANLLILSQSLIFDNSLFIKIQCHDLQFLHYQIGYKVLCHLHT